MLLADKAETQATLKKELILIEERELKYYVGCCDAIGTQAAFIGVCAFTALSSRRGLGDSLSPSDEGEPWLAIIAWLMCLIVMLLEMICVVKAIQLSILTAGLALRGPEGSMSRALVVMRSEYRRVHGIFYGGLVLFLLSAALYAADSRPEIVGYTLSGLIVVALVFMMLNFKSLRNQLFSLQTKEQREWEGPAAPPAGPPSPDGMRARAGVLRSRLARLADNKENESRRGRVKSIAIRRA